MKKRDSKFELLRILAMVFIIASHFSAFGNWTHLNKQLLKVKAFSPWGQVGVALFVMISGYFLSKKNILYKDALNRSKKLYRKTWLYSVGMLIVVLIFKLAPINLKIILKSILPIIFNNYWFITSFLVLMLLTPLLNYAVNSFTKKDLFQFLVFIIIIGEILPITVGDGPIGTFLSISVLLPPYLVGAYIQKYNIRVNSIIDIVIFLFVQCLQYIGMYELNLLGKNWSKVTVGILPFIAAICLFLLFVNLPTFYNRIINFIASGVLAAYLITVHASIYKTLWSNTLNVGRWENSPYLLLFGIMLAVVIVVICSLLNNIFSFISLYIYRKIKHN